MSEWIIIYGAIHLFCFMFMIGHMMAKFDSPFFDTDWKFGLSHVLINLVFSPLMVAITLGYKCAQGD